MTNQLLLYLLGGSELKEIWYMKYYRWKVYSLVSNFDVVHHQNRKASCEKVLKTCIISKNTIQKGIVIIPIKVTAIWGNGSGRNILQEQKIKDGPPFSLCCIPSTFRFTNSGHTLSGTSLYTALNEQLEESSLIQKF